MIDIRTLREQPELVKQAAKNKNASISSDDIDQLLKLDAKRRELLAAAEDVRRERNELSGSLGNGKPSPAQIEAGKKLKDKLGGLEEEFGKVDDEYTRLLKLVPNLPAADVPVGKSEDENVVAKKVGEPTKFDFEPKNHWQLGEARGWIDKERAAKVAGSRFAYLKGELVRLHMAVINFALDVITDEAALKRIADEAGLKVSTKPFVPVLPPLMIRTEAYDAMDRLEPRDDRYKIEGEELWLQGSAEHVLGSMHADEILPEAELPVRYAGYATSFRK
ncbi:MAG TPA: serine--tRNA ligase, partial [Candidatus Saccharimonadia bacterium]|nr:serine--tRNA ligase [Candidatus Saccharimonadia bacterium]